VSYSPPISGLAIAAKDGFSTKGDTQGNKFLPMIPPPHINTAISLNGICCQTAVVDNGSPMKLLIGSELNVKVQQCSSQPMSGLRRTCSSSSPSTARQQHKDVDIDDVQFRVLASAVEVTPLLSVSTNSEETLAISERGHSAYDSTLYIGATSKATAHCETTDNGRIGTGKTIGYRQYTTPWSPSHSDAGIQLYGSWVDVKRQYLTTGPPVGETRHRKKLPSPKTKDQKAREKIEQRRERKVF